MTGSVIRFLFAVRIRTFAPLHPCTFAPWHLRTLSTFGTLAPRAPRAPEIGDEATLFDWTEGSRPQDLAAACGASVYDLTMHLNPLLPRRVVDG